MSPLPSYPLTHHGSFTFHSRVLTHYSFPCAPLSNRVSAPLYVVHIGHIGCHSLVVTWYDNLPRLFLKRWCEFGVFQCHPYIVLRPCWRCQIWILSALLRGKSQSYALTESIHWSGYRITSLPAKRFIGCSVIGENWALFTASGENPVPKVIEVTGAKAAGEGRRENL